MNNIIRAGIIGYGNMGRGVEKALAHNKDFELTGIFSRRPVTEKTADNIYSYDSIKDFIGKIDVMFMCGGSANDLPVQVPEVAQWFNTVDSFDTHAKIPEYFANIDRIAAESNHVSLISCGWDPGLFSMMRVLSEAVLPAGKSYTFWGEGVSQGHSDAIRHVEGVADAREYTMPIQETLNSVRKGEQKDFTTREMHRRDCYVVAKPGADLARIETDIKTMPYYFSDYNTKVTFMDQETFNKEHNTMPHGGFVIRSGITGEKTKQLMEFNLKLESNPEFTASVLVCFGRAVYRMAQKGQSGAVTVFDIPLGYLSQQDRDTLMKRYL